MQVTGIERPFGGENRKFDLSPIGAWRAVEARCGVGLGKVIARLYSTTATKAIAVDEGGITTVKDVSDPGQFSFYVDDIREVLLQGLKGAGMDDGAATVLVGRVFDMAPGKGQFAPLALEIAAAWWLGLPEGNQTAPKTKSEA